MQKLHSTKNYHMLYTDFQAEVHQVAHTHGRSWNPLVCSQASSWDPNYLGVMAPQNTESKPADSLTETWKLRALLAPSEAPRFLTMTASKETGARQAVLQIVERVSLKRCTFPQQDFFTSSGRWKPPLCSTLHFILISILTEEVLWRKALDRSNCLCILTLKTTSALVSRPVMWRRSPVNSILTIAVSPTATLQLIGQTWVLFLGTAWTSLLEWRFRWKLVGDRPHL